MWNAVSTLQGWVYLLIGVGVLGAEIYALVDALRHPTAAFPRAGKLTKPIWCGILGFATLIGIVALGSPGLLTLDIIGLVAAGVYLADVKPAVKGMSGGGSSSGPYGPW